MVIVTPSCRVKASSLRDLWLCGARGERFGEKINFEKKVSSFSLTLLGISDIVVTARIESYPTAGESINMFKIES